MSKGIGRLFQVGIAKETTRGTAISTAAYWIPFSELALEEKDSKIVDDQSYGVIEDSQNQTITKQWAEGKMKAPIGDRHFPLILLSVLGSLSTTTNADASGNVRDHTITVAQSAQHQSLTYFLDDPLSGADYKNANGVIENLEIHYDMGKFLEYNITVKTQKGASTTNSPATTVENRFLPQHVTFKLASAYSGLGAASAQVIKMLSLKFENNIEDDYVLGSLSPADFLNKQFTISGTLEAMWQNESDFKTFVLAGTYKAMRIDIVNTDVTIGTSARPEVKIDLAKVIFEPVTRPIKVNDMVKQQLNFKAHYSQTDSKMVQIVVTNLITSY